MRDMVIAAVSLVFALAFLGVAGGFRGDRRTPGHWLAMTGVAIVLAAINGTDWATGGSWFSLVRAVFWLPGVAVSLFGYRVAVLRRRSDRVAATPVQRSRVEAEGSRT